MSGVRIDTARIKTFDGRLQLLEISRAVAALLVVFHHADQATAHFSDVPREQLVMWGQYGVDFFFVLSGFIIYHIHGNEPIGLVTAKRYLGKRLRRIYIPYLPVALAYMGLLLIFQNGPIAERSWGIWSTLTLLPMEKHSTLTVAWTLTYELLFYAFFLLIFAHRGLFFIASAAWVAILLPEAFGASLWPSTPKAVSVFTDPIVLEFFCGILAAMLVGHMDRTARVPLLVIGTLLLAGFIVFWTGQRALLGPPLAIIVLGLALFDKAPSAKWISWGAFFGTASYSIYLVHSPVISILAEILQPAGIRWLIFSACCIVGIGLGVAYHLLFERPALRVAASWSRKQGHITAGGSI